MSLQTQIHSLVIRVADEFKTVYSKIGNLSSLSTTDKSTLVAAINELKAAIATVAVIDDLTPGSTTTTFSASKIVTLLDALRAQILGGADAAYDTLLELQQALQNDQTGIAALTAAIDKRVRFDAVQTLTAPEQLQTRTNIGAVASIDIGDTTTDFVAIFEAQLIA
jgi:capsid protein